MKEKIIVLLVCMALLVGVLISGCIEEKEPTPTNNAPVASFTSSVAHNNTTAGGTVTFTDASTDADTDDTLTWSWNFGDASALNTTQNTTHTYAANGTYTVTLTVSDGTDTDTESASVIVGNIAPTAGFTHTADGLNVTFTDTSTDLNTDDTLTYAWDFDNDSVIENTTSGPITYEYAVGIYNATLTVTDDYGLTGTVTKEITVTA